MQLLAFVMLALVVVLWMSWPQHRHVSSRGFRSRARRFDGHPYRAPGLPSEAESSNVPRSLALARLRTRVCELCEEGRANEAAQLALREDDLPLGVLLPVLIEADELGLARMHILNATEAELTAAWNHRAARGAAARALNRYDRDEGIADPWSMTFRARWLARVDSARRRAQRRNTALN